MKKKVDDKKFNELLKNTNIEKATKLHHLFFVLKYCIVRRMRLCIIFLGKQIIKNMISSLCLCCTTNYLHLNVTELDEGG